MVIDGKVYTSDMIILPDRIIDGWRRREGHRLFPDDLEVVLESGPRKLIVGTGSSGLMVVNDATLELFSSRGIEVIAEPTTLAWKTFNRLTAPNVAGAFHLTC